MKQSITPSSAQITSSQISKSLLASWTEFQKTGNLDAPDFARRFRQFIANFTSPTAAHRRFWQHWGDILNYPELRDKILNILPLAETARYLDKIARLAEKSSQQDFPEWKRLVAELLFTFKQSPWLQKISRAGQTDEWFGIYLRLIRAGGFTLGTLLQTWTRHYRDDIIFQYTLAGRVIRLTWDEMWRRVRRIGRALQRAGRQTGVTPRVAILTENRIEGVLTDLACLAYGYVNVVVPVNAAPAHMAYIIENSHANILFVTNESILNSLLPHLSHPQHLTRIVLFGKSGPTPDPRVSDFKQFIRPVQEPAAEPEELPADIRPADLATIMYTSGTTGKPKGIMFSHENIVSKRFARALAWPDLNEDDIFLSYLPLFHTFGRWLEMTGSLFWGATYIFAVSPAINSLLKEMQLHHPSIFISIPQKWQQIYDYVAGQIDLNRSSDEEIHEVLHSATGGRLRLGLSAAGYLDPDIFRFFQRNGVELMSGFGMTEATGGITMTPPGGYKENSLGKALPGIELKLAEDGELLIRGPYVMMGYYNTDSQAFDSDGWLPTGDVMQEDSDGYLFIIDRKKEIYKNIKGQTIAPQRIENFFRDIDAVKRVFLVGDHREYNTLLIYPNFQHEAVDLTAMSQSELHDFLASVVVSVNQFLAPYERIVDFTIIDRDFSQEAGELTPKGSYRRKIIEDHFSEQIERMYRSNFVQLKFRHFFLQFPNWLLRELGILSHEVRIDERDRLMIQGLTALELETDETSPDRLRIGNLWYRVAHKRVDVGDLLAHPSLWLTNQQLVALTHEHIFTWKRFKQDVTGVSIDYARSPVCRQPEMIREAFRVIRQTHLHNLRGLHISGISIQADSPESGRQAVDYLAELARNPLDPLHQFALEMLIWAIKSPFREVKKYAFLHLFPLLQVEKWLPIFKLFLSADPLFLDPDVRQALNQWKMPEEIFRQIAALTESFLKKDAMVEGNEVSPATGTLVSFLQEFVKLHPSRYKIIRRLLTSYRMEPRNPALRQLTERALQEMQQEFRHWLGSNSPVAIDPDLGQEYAWRDVMVFDENVPDQHIYLLQELISKTPFIREAIFLFTNNLIINLKDLPPGGIWITTLGAHHGKSIYRISVQTRYQGRYDITANVITRMAEEEVLEEINWSIISSQKEHLPKLVEEFGGYWPEYHTWSEEFVPGETVAAFYQRMTRQAPGEKRVRLQFLWQYIIWSSCKAYVDFWYRTGCRFEIAEPSPENIIVPHHDYQTGTRIISITARRPHRHLADAILNFYNHFVEPMLASYPFLRATTKWQFVFSPILEILGEKEGVRQLEALLKNGEGNRISGDFKKAARAYLRSIKKQGFIPKQLYFAIKRFKRWRELNREATAEADVATLHELYDTYNLQSLEKMYPETRVRFYRQTVFQAADPELRQQLDQLILLLKEGKLKGEEIPGYVNHLQASPDLNEQTKYLLTHMGYAHLRPTDMAELLTAENGDKTTAALVVSFPDKEGEQIRVRHPINPKEVARLHRMFHQFNLPVTFQPHDRFLLAFNQRDQLVGGLFYHAHGSDTVHFEKIVVADHYRRKGVSGGLLNEFFNRMRSQGFKRVRTGFFRPEFFYRFGFRIEKGFPGLVKTLVENGEKRVKEITGLGE